jgi:hypothetical protein
MSGEIGEIWGQNNTYFLGLEKQRQIKKYTTNYPDENLTSNYILIIFLYYRISNFPIPSSLFRHPRPKG